MFLGMLRVQIESILIDLIIVTPYLIIIYPFLVSAHPVASNQFDRSLWMRSIQTIIIGHHLMSFGVCKHLIATKTMTIATADRLICLTAHCIQTILWLDILNLQVKMVDKINDNHV